MKFIFATTESHKVPVTIRSRCQQYDFRLIPHRLIAERIRAILDAEALAADEEAISVVSREAAGSMRDALTLLDQLVAISDDRITADTVAASLGIAAREALLNEAFGDTRARKTSERLRERHGELMAEQNRMIGS